MKKKITAMIVCAAVALSLTACNTDGESSSPSTSTKSSTESSKTESSTTVSSSSTESSSDSKPEESGTESTAPEESSAPEQPAANEADFETKAVDGGVSIWKYKGSDENVVIPETICGEKVVGLGEAAFQDNIDITSVTIPDSVEYFMGYEPFHTFGGCLNLKEVIFLGNDMPDFTVNDFLNTPWLEEKRAENPDYTIVNNMLLEWRNREGAVVIPDGVTKIAPRAFYKNTQGFVEFSDGITEITIPNSVTEIGYGAFSGCFGLKSITLPKNITKIDNSTFYECRSLETIDIPNGVTSIGSGVFNFCPANVTFPDSVTQFIFNEDIEVYNAAKITYKGKTYGGSDGYYGYNDLFDAITFGDSDMQIVDNVLVKVKTSATKIEIPETVTSIADGAFKSCDSSIIITYKGKNYNGQNLSKFVEAINGN